MGGASGPPKWDFFKNFRIEKMAQNSAPAGRANVFLVNNCWGRAWCGDPFDKKTAQKYWFFGILQFCTQYDARGPNSVGIDWKCVQDPFSIQKRCPGVIGPKNNSSFFGPDGAGHLRGPSRRFDPFDKKLGPWGPLFVYQFLSWYLHPRLRSEGGGFRPPSPSSSTTPKIPLQKIGLSDLLKVIRLKKCYWFLIY